VPALQAGRNMDGEVRANKINEKERELFFKNFFLLLPLFFLICHFPRRLISEKPRSTCFSRLRSSQVCRRPISCFIRSQHDGLLPCAESGFKYVHFMWPGFVGTSSGFNEVGAYPFLLCISSSLTAWCLPP
jgi:hypothetical protein